MPRSYRLLRKLGEGAFGEVHLAEMRDEDEDFVQTLAVKWLHAQFSHDVHLAGRLRDEARLLALLNHEHIVRVHGLTRIDGRLAVLMEPVDGIDLSSVAREQVPPAAALEIVASVADALAAAWDAMPNGASGPLRVVHRDIKPSNVMVTARGAVKVMDFGVARASFDTREAQTRSQQFGTARYMAPERWLEGVSEAPSDVYSLGITLIELASGTEIERMRLSPKAFAEDLSGALDRLEALPGVKQLAETMCALDPEERPNAAHVATRARELAATVGGQDLREWSAARCAVATLPVTFEPTIVAEDGSGETFAVTAEFGALTQTASASLGTGTASDLSADLARRPWFWPGLGAVVVLAILFGVIAGPYMRSSQAEPTVVETVPEPAPAAVPPAPEAEPEPEPEPETPEPVPEVQPQPSPSLAPVAAPSPERARPRPVPVVSEPVAPMPAVVELGSVTFVLEPSDLSVRTSAGPVASRRAVELPVGSHEVRVVGKEGDWECTVLVHKGHSQYVVRGTDKVCVATR